MLSNRNFLAALGSAAAAVALLVLNKKIATSAQTKQELEAASLASLFDKLGGKPNLKLAVSNFYDKVLKDKRVSHFFKRTDMNLLMNQQQSFLCLLFGGPNRYVGQSMKDAHKNMNITSEQFEVIVNLLIESFEELHVADQLIQEIRQKLDGIKNQIILQ